jgi:hypothetical protein
MFNKLCFIIILFVLIIAPSFAYCVTSTKSIYTENSYNDTKPLHNKKHLSTYITVINIIIDKIENGFIYSKDGEVFTINESTQTINNHNSESNLRVGELFFSNGKLIIISIK